MKKENDPNNKKIDFNQQLKEREKLMEINSSNLSMSYSQFCQKSKEIETLERTLQIREMKQGLKEKEIEAKLNFVKNSLLDFAKQRSGLCKNQKNSILDRKEEILMEKEETLENRTTELERLEAKLNELQRKSQLSYKG